uniref:Uncharacterized protein n=1 Tax=Magnaporthiopsis poae (strain ATCC 64411 / 73-15) TaxID=644358 RepID=A0A0C4E4L2_MAGP6
MGAGKDGAKYKLHLTNALIPGSPLVVAASSPRLTSPPKNSVSMVVNDSGSSEPDESDTTESTADVTDSDGQPQQVECLRKACKKQPAVSCSKAARKAPVCCKKNAAGSTDETDAGYKADCNEDSEASTSQDETTETESSGNEASSSEAAA